MSSADRLKYEELAKFMEGALYDQLTSTEKSEEFGVDFLELALGERRKNYSILKKISRYFGEIMADKMEVREGQNLSGEEKSILIRTSVREAYVKWEMEDG